MPAPPERSGAVQTLTRRGESPAIKLKTMKDPNFFQKQREEQQKRKEAAERHDFLTLISEIRIGQNVKSMNQNIEVWISELWYDVTYNDMGKDYANCDLTFHNSKEDIDTDVEIGQMLLIKKTEMQYSELIDLYFSDDMYRISDRSSDVETIEPTGESIEGAVIVEWSWEKYVGYCRNFHGLRFGESNETEQDLITGNEERTFNRNLSILVEASELEGLTDAEKVEAIKEAFSQSHWKWNYFNTPNFQTSIEDYLGLTIENED